MMMMLDDVYGSDEAPVPQQQDSELSAAEDFSLEWEETEIRKLARELSGQEQLAD
jgi:hypothetical protein